MNNRKGLTLAEMLIVMALTVVLAAAAIPTFGGQLENARNQERRLRLEAKATEETLEVLKESRENPQETEFLRHQPEEVVQQFRDFQQSSSEEIEISSQGSIITIDRETLRYFETDSESIKSVDYLYVIDENTGVLRLETVIIYGEDWVSEFAAEEEA